MDTNERLACLNTFTRREHTADEVYIFSVILCDNEVDRDHEKFTLPALQRLKALFVGKTGIFDHNARGANQTARIFSAQVVSEPGKTTADGEEYACLKADAYMVRTASNADLIKEIDGGIKKEVSVSCAAGSAICSVCGAEQKKKPCSHTKGRTYGAKKCFHRLDDITDAYEWSFVAVPAQVNAGITKFFGGEADPRPDDPQPGFPAELPALGIPPALPDTIRKEITAEVLRLGFLSQPKMPAAALALLLDRMTLEELYALKKSFLRETDAGVRSQLSPASAGGAEPFKPFRFGEGEGR